MGAAVPVERVPNTGCLASGGDESHSGVVLGNGS